MRVPVHFSVPVVAVLLSFSLPSSLLAAPIVFADSGAVAADIQDTLDLFRAHLGILNPNVPGSLGSGRREINWDGTPDSFSSPNAFPGDFFNQNLPGRARGVEFSTPGTGFEVSADSSNPTSTPVQFGNIDPGYPALFKPFSDPRLFAARGSTITDVAFFVPGTNTRAATTGFGVVFSDVDQANATSLTFFDPLGNSLGQFFAPSIAGNQTFSFLGVSFGNALVGRVRITSGNQVLAPGNTVEDLVVMDDFIFGEPQAVPEPATVIVLGGMSLLSLPVMHRRKGRRC